MGRSGRSHGWPRAETSQPGGSFRISILPAKRSKSEIKIAQGTADGDCSQIDSVQSACTSFKFNQAAIDFVHLSLDPILPAQGFRARKGFVSHQHRGVQ